MTPEKAFSIQQPWAWLIVNGFKDIENRDWMTNLRGRIAIHASKKFDHDGLLWVQCEFPEIELPRPASFERGGIVGSVTVVDCVKESASRWFVGRWGFVLADAKPCEFRPLRGQLGFFDVPPLLSEDPTHAE